MRSVGREAFKTAATVLGLAALIGGTLGWIIGDSLERLRQRRAR